MRGEIDSNRDQKTIRNTSYPARIIIIPLFWPCVKLGEKMIGKSKKGY
jgi:hypothetical protein